MTRVFATILLATILGTTFPAAQPAPAQEQFVPVTDAETERLPAAPLVMSAYAIAWVAIFLYVWSLWRRLSRVERELDQLAANRRGPR